MQKKGFLSLNLSEVKQYLPFITFAVLFVVGLIVGSVSVGRNDYLFKHFSEVVKDFIAIRSNFNFFSVVKNSFLISAPFYFATFLCGTSLIGCAISPLISLYKGFYVGCISGSLYSIYKLNGVVLNALILIPSNIVSIFGLCLILCESFSFSYLLSGICIKTNAPVNVYSSFKRYCVRCLVYSLFALLSIFIDMGMSAMFIGLFNF